MIVVRFLFDFDGEVTTDGNYNFYAFFALNDCSSYPLRALAKERGL